MKTIMIPVDEQTHYAIEGHPINVDKIIQGDLRTETRIINGENQTYQHTDGQILYDS